MLALIDSYHSHRPYSQVYVHFLIAITQYLQNILDWSNTNLVAVNPLKRSGILFLSLKHCLNSHKIFIFDQCLHNTTFLDHFKLTLKLISDVKNTFQILPPHVQESTISRTVTRLRQLRSLNHLLVSLSVQIDTKLWCLTVLSGDSRNFQFFNLLPLMLLIFIKYSVPEKLYQQFPIKSLNIQGSIVCRLLPSWRVLLKKKNMLKNAFSVSDMLHISMSSFSFPCRVQLSFWFNVHFLSLFYSSQFSWSLFQEKGGS